MNIQIHQEYLEGDDPEQDIEELNRTASKPMYKSAALNAQTSFSKSKNQDIESSYENIIKKYKDHFKPKESENYNEDYDQKFIKKTTEENPLSTFEKLQSEVELIEKDLKYYSENKDSYKIVGRLIPGKYEVDCRISSQFITGLLFSLPLLKKDSKIVFNKKLESKQYVKITLYVLKKFGIKIKKIRNGFKVFGNQKFKETNFVVEADYSKAAFFSIVGALHPIEIFGLNKKSLQKDKKILNIIKKCGAMVKFKKDVLFVIPKKKLKPFKYNVKNTPDIAICLAIFACFCSGVSKIKGVRRLQFKESNRINSILNLINSLGGVASFFKDCIIIKGGKKLKGGFVKGFKDHRVVMAAFFISCFCEDFVYVSDVESILKSNVSFFEDFKALGGVFYGVCF